MNQKLVDNIIAYAKRAADIKLCGNGVNNISVKESENTIYITKSGVNFANITAEDVIVLSLNDSAACPKDLLDAFTIHSQVYIGRPDVACIFVTCPTASFTVAALKATIPPVLDDMAQIVGPTARTAKSLKNTDILKALKGRGACLLTGVGALATGRTIDEAYTNSLVLDKAAHTYIMSFAVGGCKPVGKISAFLEHIVYQKKYSKANQEALLEAERK